MYEYVCVDVRVCEGVWLIEAESSPWYSIYKKSKYVCKDDEKRGSFVPVRCILQRNYPRSFLHRVSYGDTPAQE